MNFYTLTSKRGLKPLTIGIFTALLLSAAWGLAYKWNPAATPTMPASELAGLDTMALMAKFRIQPLGRVPIGNFQLKNLDGNFVNITSFRGKVVLLNIWATW